MKKKYPKIALVPASRSLRRYQTERTPAERKEELLSTHSRSRIEVCRSQPSDDVGRQRPADSPAGGRKSLPKDSRVFKWAEVIRWFSTSSSALLSAAIFGVLFAATTCYPLSLRQAILFFGSRWSRRGILRVLCFRGPPQLRENTTKYTTTTGCVCPRADLPFLDLAPLGV